MTSRTKSQSLPLGVLGLGLGLTMGVAACAATSAPKNLVDARAAYTRAADGPAAEIAPAQLYTAKEALDRAELAFEKKPKSERVDDLAYIAHRKALAAEVEADTIAARQRAEASAERYGETQEAITEQTEAELAQARSHLSTANDQLSVEQRRALEAEQARAEAEARAQRAIASLEKVAAVKEEQRGMVITLSGSVLFATGQSTLLPIAQDRLGDVAKALIDQPGRHIIVEGHTDSVGSATANQQLSQQRAMAVRDYLISRGVERDRIEAKGYGAGRPITDNKTASARANNRRVEIVVEPLRADSGGSGNQRQMSATQTR